MEETANNKEALLMTGLEPIKIQDKVDEAVAEIGKVVLGKEKQIRLSLCCLFAGGHLLMEDKPGIGKTTLSQALARFLVWIIPVYSLPVTCYRQTSSGLPFMTRVLACFLFTRDLYFQTSF